MSPVTGKESQDFPPSSQKLGWFSMACSKGLLPLSPVIPVDFEKVDLRQQEKETYLMTL